MTAIGRKWLEAMTIAGALTCGGYFTLLGPSPYRIALGVRPPGGGQADARDVPVDALLERGGRL